MARQSDSTEARTRRAAAQKLESLQAAGVSHLPKPKARPKRTAPPAAAALATEAPAAATPATKAAAHAAPARPLTAAPQQDSLAILQQEVVGCTRCSELATTRTQTVFGVGNPKARLCFLGEAPGADEDMQGEPFVGKAGQLLNKIIEACTLKREDVYIMNVLKCRPPGNRTPLPDEVANCRGFRDRQLAVLQPEFICCLGAVAAQALLETETTIGRLRGKFHKFGASTVICTYHPAYLLRNPAAKKDVWEDMKMLMHEMGIPL